MKKKIVSRMLFALLLLSASISVFSIQPAQAQEELPTVYFEPALSSALSGEHFTVDIMVKDVERLFAWQVNMTFNPNILQFVNVTEGDFLTSQPEGTWAPSPLVDNSGGTVLFGCTTLGPYVGVSGSGWLATIEFSVTDYGASLLFIDNNLTKLIEYRPPPPPPGETVMRLIPHTRENGFFSTDVAELLRSYAELSASYSSLLADYTTLLADYAALSTSYSSQTSIYQSLLMEYEDLHSKFEDSESDYATLRANFDSLNSTYVALKADFDSLDSTYTSLQSEQNDMQSRYDTLSGDLTFATNLNYVLAIATAILVVTTLLLLRKKRS